MLDSFRALKAGNLAAVNNSLLMPLVRWCSGSVRDLEWCAEVDRYTFFIDKNVLKTLLFIGLRDTNTYVKYPKAVKLEKSDKLTELKKAIIQKYYGWSDQEYSRNIAVLDYADWEVMATAIGCDRKERKLLGIKDVVVKEPVVIAKKKSKTLFDF